MILRVPPALALLMAGSLVAGLPAGAMGAPPAREGYTLGPGDTIEITVVGDHDLSRAVTIKPEGTIDLPLVGEVRAAGKTTSQLAGELIRRYSKYLVAPSITVAVREFRVDRIYILGQVYRPGEFQIRPGVGILELLASAGGPTDRADLAKATIIRGKTEAIELNLLDTFAKSKSPDVTLLPGDVLYVPAADRRIVILGQVQRPGAYDFLEGQRVSNLLAGAGGVSPRAAPQRAFIVRNGEQILVDVQKVLAGDTEANVPLQAGDMMVVPESQDRIAVMGSVNRPGTYEFDQVKGMKLIDAIGLAGGQQPENGDLSQVAIVRIEGGKTKTISADLNRALSGKDMSQNLPLQPGDVVYVPEKGMTLGKAAQFFSVLSVVKYLFGIF
jgi:polysaccharide export outer membrane protein